MNNYAEYLELDFDPFLPGSTSRDFYCSGQRQQLLDQIVEFSLYSNALVAVAGPLGAGKTTLAENFCDRFADEAICVKVTATLFMTPSQFLEPFRDVLPTVSDASDDVESIIAQICQYTAELDLEARSLMLIIDDAHELNADVLQIIASLSEKCVDSSIHTLLFGEESLESLLDNTLSADAQERLAVFFMEGLASDETLEYISFKMAAAGFVGDLPLPDDTLGEIHASSQGMPGAINTLAMEALNSAVQTEEPEYLDATEVEVETEVEEIEGSWIHNVQPVYWMVAASLVVALMMTLVFWDVELDTKASSVAVVSAKDNDELHRIELPINLDANVEITGAELPEQDVAELTAVVGIGEVDAGEAQEEHSQLASVTVEPNTETQAEVTVDIGTEEGKEKQGKEIEDAASLAVIETAEAMPDVPDSGVAMKAEQEPTLTGISDFEKHLLHASSQNYTVQLLASHSEANLKGFISGLEIEQTSGYFETQYNDKPWFVAVIGDFSDRTDAATAIANLPETLRSYRPWVRSIADIQGDIRQRMAAKLVSAN
jgi:DamX protein